MGAEFNFKKLKAATQAEALKEGHQLIDQARYESGHGGYTGTWAECTDVEFRDDEVDPVEVESWLDANAEKWGPMLIVKAGESYYAGAICSS